MDGYIQSWGYGFAIGFAGASVMIIIVGMILLLTVLRGNEHG